MKQRGNKSAIVSAVALCVSLALASFAAFAESGRSTGFVPPANHIVVRAEDDTTESEEPDFVKPLFRPDSAASSLLSSAAYSSSSSLLSSAAASLSSSSSSSLPTSWDSRDYGWVSSVKSQGSVGACWAFASMATLETQLLMADKGEYDLSEKNMINLHGFNVGFNDGGNYYYSLAYLMRWGGAVAETNDVFVSSTSKWTTSEPLMPICHVQNVVWVSARSSVTDNTTLKTAIMTYGAVATAIYWASSYESTSNYYCNVSTTSNHAITVIGWDDDYPAENFATTPAGNGAWLIKNSWGTSYGDKGYYHVSYYDVNFAMVEGAVFIPATDEEDYDAVYGYDRLGVIYATGTQSDYSLEAAVFTSAWNEEIAAVGVYSNIESNSCEISVFTNVTRTTATSNPNPLAGGALAAKVSTTLTTAGFTTVHLEDPIPIPDRSNFAVVYRQTNKSKRSHCYSQSIDNSDGTAFAEVEATAGNTYWGKTSSGGSGSSRKPDSGSSSSSTTTNWIDLATYSSYTGSVACLKAYTRSTLAANSADAPSESDSGTDALTWLAATNATLYTETSASFGAFANLVGANGRTLWASYLAGFDPYDADDNELVLSISVTNSVPYLSWQPNLGSDARTYTIYGATDLSLQDWLQVDDLTSTDARFFKVSVSQP